MTTTDLIMKSIENLILYGIEINIAEEDYNEYLFQMENYFNENSDDLVATLSIDTLIIDTIDNQNVCNLFIKDEILRIVPTANEHTFATIILTLEFIAEKNHLFQKEDAIEEEESNDDFDWI
jgi:hypothetical protein|tara:strand:- start:1968 stop:2333 length:366 start_codon:yes stop_codon:yes gene_type:complete